MLAILYPISRVNKAPSGVVSKEGLGNVGTLPWQVRRETHPHETPGECLGEMFSIRWAKANSLALFFCMCFYNCFRACEYFLKVNNLMWKLEATDVALVYDMKIENMSFY